MNNVFFTKAKPIWIANKNKNTHIKLFASVNAEEAEYIRIATSGLYQLFINGEFVAAGPVRSGRGYFRIDCIDISDRISLAVNKVEILCVHYGIPCYGLMLQEPFVTCEITKNDMIICSTGGNGFDVCLCKDYIDKVSRYSFQRGFAESYLVGEAKNEYVNPVVCNDRKYIERVAPYPFYERKEIAFSTIGICTYEKQTEHKKEWWNDEDTEKYAIDKVFEELQDINYFKGEKVILNKALLSDKEYVIGSVHHNITGVLSFECNCRRETVLYVTYDEIMQDSFVNPQRNSCNACVKYRIKPGEHKVVNFEPGTMKYICFTVISGEIEISKAYVIEYKHKPETNVVEIDDFELKKIYDAAVETFRQNAFDIYTDCPSRERAGWLCDSFFMGRAEHLLYGESLVEKAFLENYLMEDIFKNLPEGMFPMCYPADHPTGCYIPNWAMWLMIELEEYYNRTGDFELVSRYKVKAYKLLDFFKKYENIDGLLEKLDEWVFVDWSKSGDYVQDVNFPTNMLYAYMLEKISVLFYDESLKIKAENVKEKIRKLSYNGEFFCDNLIITDGKYENPGNTTEACQYYAFFTGTATKKEYPDLWRKLKEEFGPDRLKKGLHLDVPPSNAFIGNYLRLECLAKNGCRNELLNEIKGYFSYMADVTGTLWEKVDDEASLNHGFAAQVAVWIYEGVNGV